MIFQENFRRGWVICLLPVSGKDQRNYSKTDHDKNERMSKYFYFKGIKGRCKDYNIDADRKDTAQGFRFHRCLSIMPDSQEEEDPCQQSW